MEYGLLKVLRVIKYVKYKKIDKIYHYGFFIFAKKVT